MDIAACKLDSSPMADDLGQHRERDLDVLKQEAEEEHYNPVMQSAVAGRSLLASYRSESVSA